MPRVSIITTTYNHKKFIVETIESVLNQSFTDWELLIWDDSPNLGTWRIVQDFIEKYPEKIRAWHHDENLWIVGNMNFLINQVHQDSQFVAFLEWDDLFEPDYLQQKIDIFTAFDNVWMVYNNLDFMNENGEIIESDYFSKIDRIFRNEKLDLEHYLDNLNSYFSFSTMMLRKGVFQNIKIETIDNDKYFLNSDCIFFADVGAQYNIYWLEEVLTRYRRHSNNISSNPKITTDLLASVEYIRQKYNVTKKWYKYYSLRSYASYLKNHHWDAIVNGVLSFKYNIKIDIVPRIWIIILSLFPKNIAEYIFHLYRNRKKDSN